MAALRNLRNGGWCDEDNNGNAVVPIAKLVPYVNNARTHSPEQITKLRSSLREFGFINPVIIDRDFNVIAGHGRILAAKKKASRGSLCVCRPPQ